MLGKQWLNRYDTVDMRGSTIERSQNRQRKLDGIVVWYFEHVMESLPMMLQVALLLLGCALSRYLWEVNTTVASVVMGVTSFGVICYAIIIVAGTVSESCPYQTPGAQILRYLWQIAPGYSTIQTTFIKKSKLAKHLEMRPQSWALMPWWSVGNIWWLLKHITITLPIALAHDTLHISLVIFKYLITAAQKAYSWLRSFLTTGNPTAQLADAYPASGQLLGQRAVALDFRCISWMLVTSLDQPINLLTLKFLGSILTLPGFNSTIIEDCFNVLAGCVNVATGGRVVIVPGSKELAATAAVQFLLAFSHTSIVGPASSILKDVRRRYQRTFPHNVDLQSLPFYHTMAVLHGLIYTGEQNEFLEWNGYNIPTPECPSLAHALVKIAWSGYQRSDGQRKVPRWVLRFSLPPLSQHPQTPPPVIADCLLIIAIDLDCGISENDVMGLDKRCV